MQQSKRKTEEVGSKVSDFKIIKELGKGSYGTVYTVKSLINSNIYVMKKMELNHLNPRQQVECYREVSILKKVSHKNIIKYYSSFLEKNILYIIMEYAELGDLYSLIKHYKKHSKFFSELDLWKISSEILSGLDYLHSHNIIHRDIKCLNLFITKDLHIKIGDLGVSAFSSGGENFHYTRVGTPLYISPELVKQKPYDYKTDIWSFGCSLYHLACLEPPFTGGNLIVLGNNIVKGVPKALPNHYSNDLKNFVDKMLEKKAEKRPSAKEALDMIPNNILNDMKTQGEKIVIKSKRPFSSAVNINSKVTGNKIIAVNKEEIKNIFGDNENSNINTKDNTNNKNENIKSQEKNNKNENTNTKEIKHKRKSEEKNRVLGRNMINNENDNFYFLNNFNLKSYNDIKEKKDISSENITNHKKIYDLSFNIPSFNNQKGFNNFRKKQKLIFENNFPGLNLGKKNNNINKFNQLNFHNLQIFSPFCKDNNISKQSLKRYLQHNLIEQNSDRYEKKKEKEINKNINVINNEIKNINIININQITPNPQNSEEKNHQNKSEKNNNNYLVRLNTDNNQFSLQNKIKFPELNQKSNNNINVDLINNNINTNNLNIKNKNKRLPSAKPIPLRPLTSKVNKLIPFKNRIDILNNNYANIIRNNENLNSDTKRNYTENKNKNKKNINRPMTGFHPQINNNVMNININFYNIDMNKRFLIPEINPLKQENNNIKNENKDNLMDTLKFKNVSRNNNINELDLDKYKNSNEFIFQKIIKSIQEIQGNDKRLTIKDLV